MGTWGQLMFVADVEDVASVSAGAEQEFTVAVPGAKTTYPAVVSAPSLESGLVATAYVSATDTVTVRVSNVSAGAVNPASQTFYVGVLR